MRKLFLVTAIAVTPSLASAKEYYLLGELNKPAVEEVIETTGESDRRKPVRTFLSTRIKSVGGILANLRNKE